MEDAQRDTAYGVEDDLHTTGDVILDRLDSDLLKDLDEHDFFLLQGN